VKPLFSSPWRPLVWLGAAVALLLPWPGGPQGRLESCLFNLLHVPLLFVLTLMLKVQKPGRRLGIMAFWILLIEGVQWILGRQAEWEDIGMGLVGLLLALLVRSTRRGKALGIVLLLLALLPLGAVLLARSEAGRTFPALATPRSPLEPGRWQPYGCAIHRVRIGEEWVLRVIVTGGQPYPGVFLVEAPGDWSRMEELVVRLFWPGSEPRNFWLRADDRGSGLSYANRVQSCFQLKPGLNTLAVRRSDWAATPSGRTFEFDRVHSLGLFWDNARNGDRVDILEVRLRLVGVPADEKH